MRGWLVATFSLVTITICALIIGASSPPPGPGAKPAPVTLTALRYAYPAELLQTHQQALVTVGPGDTLSKISLALYGTKHDWPSIWWVNRRKLPNPDALAVGETLVLPRHVAVPGWLRMAAQAALPDPTPVAPRAPTPNRTGSSVGGSALPSTPVSTPGDSSFEACVIARESGGNPQVMNSSGHYGLFQFDLGTWISGGGSAADFGHASVAEQQAVFNAVFAARGTEPWAPSDGC